jgi:DNA-binding winged helix-turn-helix (wHTH) protein
MPVDRYHFGGFVLDPQNRQLTRDEVPLDLNTRYFDALTLLVRENGTLISKERFLEEVWAGVPVTDEALTQCIRTLRKCLGDDAGQPQFIETVVKHGYRFIGDIGQEAVADTAADIPDEPAPTRARILRPGLAGTMGGGVAGLICGTLYGLVATSQPTGMEAGSVSTLVVVAGLTFAMALVGALGVSLGTATGRALSPKSLLWGVAGGGAGGLLVGAIVNLLGMDAIALLFGHSPGRITGAMEGFCVGAAVGLGLWIDERINRQGSAPVRLAISAGSGAAGGLAAALFGGRLMGGSLASLARHFPASHLRLDDVGRTFGEAGFGPLSQTLATSAEGALFCACVVMAMSLWGGPRRRF